MAGQISGEEMNRRKKAARPGGQEKPDLDNHRGLDPEAILDAVSEGLYVTDTDRKIVYWSRSAERITGWPATEILGKHCYDGVLCHMDKDGHRLCGEEYCPLHRCMVTGQSSTFPIIVFAQHKTGSRVPLNASVAPIRNTTGEVVGGVETFRDLTADFADIQRVRQIQRLSLHKDLPKDRRIQFATHYVPHDVIGGDYYAVARLDADRYGFILADVTGHGVPAALYTMYLSSLWESCCQLVARPSEFAETVNGHLCNLIKEDEPFAAAICGAIDLQERTLRLCGAGNPWPLLIRPDGDWQQLQASGLPLGVLKGGRYEERTMEIRSGDHLLFFTDGAIEVALPNGVVLGAGGLEAILRELGYPESEAGLAAVEERILAKSDRIRLEDDLTFLEVRINQCEA
jgi:phosphoserine phosphatase RsbU/P